METLNAEILQQRLGGEPVCYFAGLSNGGLQLLDQRTTRDRPAFAELLVSGAHVRRAAQSGNDPLAQVAAEVQNDITSGIGGGVGTPPDFFFTEQLQAAGDAG